MNRASRMAAALASCSASGRARTMRPRALAAQAGEPLLGRLDRPLGVLVGGGGGQDQHLLGAAGGQQVAVEGASLPPLSASDEGQRTGHRVKLAPMLQGDQVTPATGDGGRRAGAGRVLRRPRGGRVVAGGERGAAAGRPGGRRRRRAGHRARRADDRLHRSTSRRPIPTTATPPSTSPSIPTSATGGWAPTPCAPCAGTCSTTCGHHRITIDPSAGNARAIASYRKVGFRDIGIMRRYERANDGNWRDSLLMDLLAEELVSSPPSSQERPCS